MTDRELVDFLRWCLPRLGFRWEGFRKVRGTVRKRLARRMRELGLPDLESYRRQLDRDPGEWRTLDAMCRIPISRFYRDRGVYDLLATDLLPDCAAHARAHADGAVHILSAGCASGEEAYTVSLIWSERVLPRFADCSVDIVGVDVEEHMLERARAATYPRSQLRELPPDLLDIAFDEVGGAMKLRARFASTVRFERHDIRDTVPSGPFDLILCRNSAFIYFAADVRDRVFRRLDAVLRPGGYLVVGAHDASPGAARGYRACVSGVPAFQKPRPPRSRARNRRTAS